ncbi:MAG: hypothetical protein HY394_03375 [Candidatus Diapherotrites archaeon]|nr:hypothetical protein [Candidatus Diapherotrites archaeon]
MRTRRLKTQRLPKKPGTPPRSIRNPHTTRPNTRFGLPPERLARLAGPNNATAIMGELRRTGKLRILEGPGEIAIGIGDGEFPISPAVKTYLTRTFQNYVTHGATKSGIANLRSQFAALRPIRRRGPQE